ncbi:MAG: hypothetical protein CVU77_01945 [Elusimicrobia bacterium HGW-Elusimicrobia-1]|nr:MAG: hypothetical protein CVU77_01945 [Elusimicrobia bacterium HGW-Elusimicrobia-1]
MPRKPFGTFYIPIIITAQLFFMPSCATTPSAKNEPSLDLNSLRDVTHLPQGENTYILKNGTLYLAGKSRVTLILESYCLDVDKPAPDRDEIYYFVAGPPGKIPLYKEILSFVADHPEARNQSFIQNLLWNLRNNVKFEDLSQAERDFLLRIEQLAYLKINSRLKESLWKRLVRFAQSIFPSGGETLASLTKGLPLSYADYAGHIRNLSLPSGERPPAAAVTAVPMPIGNTGLYGIAYTRGYSRMKVVIYNPSNPKELILKFVGWFTKEWKDAMKEATKGWEKFKKQDIGTAGNATEGGDEY